MMESDQISRTDVAMSESGTMRKRGATIWLTGLSGAGKTTIARSMLNILTRDRFRCVWLDGDHIRRGLNSDLGFSQFDRNENIRRIGEVAIIAATQNCVSIVSVISPIARAREAVREQHMRNHVPFFEIYVSTPLEVCEQRDPKGLYARARTGDITMFTGINQDYETPERPELIVNTVGTPKDVAVEIISHFRNQYGVPIRPRQWQDPDS